MATVIGSLLVSLGLDSAQFSRGLTKAERDMGKTERAFKKIGGAVVGAIGGLAVGEIASQYRQMSLSAIDSAKSIERMAQVANASSVEFQKVAFAAKSVGIETDKIADIYKDVNDKVGDFLSTGGGEMKDFFENIAPKVGVTAEQFRKLSGPDALQLYVSSLEKAGVNQQQMTFYMESIADEATMLLPLLRNGGEAMDKYADTFERLGLAMTPEDIKNAKAASAAIGEINAAVEAQQNKKLIENIDAIVSYERAIGDLKLGLISSVGELEQANQRYNAWAAENNLPKYLKNVWSSFDEFVQRMNAGGARFAESFRASMASTVAMVQRLAGSFVAVGRDIVLGLVKGIRNAGPMAWSAIKGVVSGAVSRAKAELGIKSPSRVFMEIGDYIGEGLAIGIDGGTGKVSAATKKLTDAARREAEEIKSVLTRLFPEIEEAKKYRRELALLDRAGLSDDDLAKARSRLGREVAGVSGPAFVAVANDNDPLVAADELAKAATKTADAMAGLKGQSDITTVQVAKSFKDMADATMQSLQTLAGAIKGGGFLDILSAVVGLGLQLGSAGAFGKGVADRINLPKRAMGGPVNAGTRYLVGEKGPEIFTAARNGHIVPNHEIGRGGGIAQIVPSPYFDVVVDGRVQRQAPGTAAMGAQMAGMQSARAQSRRW